MKNSLLMLLVALELVIPAGGGQLELKEESKEELLRHKTVWYEAVEEVNQEAAYIAKTVWGEARGCSVEEQEKVIWCILNRVDSELPYFPDDIIGVITQPNQFHGYSPDYPVTSEHYELALDVLKRWNAEKRGEESNRNLPPEYVYFHGDGKHNYFRVEF